MLSGAGDRVDKIRRARFLVLDRVADLVALDAGLLHQPALDLGAELRPGLVERVMQDGATLGRPQHIESALENLDTPRIIADGDRHGDPDRSLSALWKKSQMGGSRLLTTDPETFAMVDGRRVLVVGATRARCPARAFRSPLARFGARAARGVMYKSEEPSWLG
jgi:hypothetical protein